MYSGHSLSFRWLFSYLFQPTAFKSDFEEGFLRRTFLMVRFLLPIFLCTYPIALIVRLVLPPFFSDLYVCHLAHGGLWRLLVDTAWGTAVGMAGGILGAMALNIPGGVTLCISIGLFGGMLVDTSTQATGAADVAVLASSIYGILFGLLFGLMVSNLQFIQARSILAVLLGSIISSLTGIVVGLGAGFLGGALPGTVPGITGSDGTTSAGGRSWEPPWE